MERLPFIPDYVYKRSAIHDQYGGNRQSGISPCANAPYIFIFSGSTGEQFGYKDGWDNEDIFSYTGEGQEGDMKLTKGNLALKDHVKNGKRVFLFQYQSKGFVKFVTELEFFDVDSFSTLDKHETYRVGLKFFFKRKGAHIPVTLDQINQYQIQEDIVDYRGLLVPSVTERSGLVTSRVGQGAYRKRVIYRWKYQCAVTKFDRLEVLIASHIVPWAKASNEERLDVHNGLLLSPTYDALFDKHLITFDRAGKIVLSNKIETSAFEKIGVTGKERIEGLSTYNFSYLERHNELFAI